jgi:APA family basic amino acid/polyamine antiporter
LLSGIALQQVSTEEPRALGFVMCTALIVGNVIGIGIFVMPASLAPFGLNALTGWLVTAVGCTFLAVSFAGLARAFPQDDGPYTYSKRAFGDGIAFTVMWCYWVSTWVTNATIAIGVVGYLTVLVPAVNKIVWLQPVTALTLLWLFVLINLRGARTVGWVQLLSTVLKLLPLLCVIILGVWLLVTQPSVYVQHVPPNPSSIRQVSSVSTIALVAMLGIECAIIPACRVRDPRRTIPKATVAGALLTAVIYVCVSVVPMLLIPQNELAVSNAPFADLFARILGARSGQVIALFVIISGLGALNGWTLMVGEVTQSIARHGRFPASLSKENVHGAPTLALIVSGAIASIMLLSNYSESIAGAFAFLSVVVTAANLPLYLVCALAVIRLGRRAKTAPLRSGFSMWAVAAAIAAAYCVWVSIGIGVKPLLWTLALGAVGIPVYYSSRFFRRDAAMIPGAD